MSTKFESFLYFYLQFKLKQRGVSTYMSKNKFIYIIFEQYWDCILLILKFNVIWCYLFETIVNLKHLSIERKIGMKESNYICDYIREKLLISKDIFTCIIYIILHDLKHLSIELWSIGDAGKNNNLNLIRGYILLSILMARGVFKR